MKNKPICYVPGREIPEVFSGVPSFLGLPVIRTDKELEESDIVFMGVPWEGVNTNGPFTSVEMATKTVRKASTRYGGYLPDFDIDVFDHFSGGDIGDVAVRNGKDNYLHYT